MVRKEGIIAKEGYTLAACFGSAGLLAGLLGWNFFSLIFFLLLFFVLFFFRNPKRKIPPGENSLVSPADGKIMSIEFLNPSGEILMPLQGTKNNGNNPPQPPFSKGGSKGGFYPFNKGGQRGFSGEKVIKISIFMGLFDVHINRAPISGKVTKLQYSPGKFLSAYKDKASQENERNFIVLENSKRITLVQVAGLIARRIVCYVKEGEFLEKGAKLGMIKFGSRVDVFLPSNIRIVVKEGQRVKGGETILGYLL